MTQSNIIDNEDEVLALEKDRQPMAFWMQTGIKNETAAQKLAASGIKVVMDRCLAVYTSRYQSRKA